MTEPARGVAWDEDFWVDNLMSGSAGYVSADRMDDPPKLLVPDRERGGFKEHLVVTKRRRPLGF